MTSRRISLSLLLLSLAFLLLSGGIIFGFFGTPILLVSRTAPVRLSQQGLSRQQTGTRTLTGILQASIHEDFSKKTTRYSFSLFVPEERKTYLLQISPSSSRVDVLPSIPIGSRVQVNGVLSGTRTLLFDPYAQPPPITQLSGPAVPKTGSTRKTVFRTTQGVSQQDEAEERKYLFFLADFLYPSLTPTPTRPIASADPYVQILKNPDSQVADIQKYFREASYGKTEFAVDILSTDWQTLSLDAQFCASITSFTEEEIQRVATEYAIAAGRDMHEYYGMIVAMPPLRFSSDKEDVCHYGISSIGQKTIVADGTDYALGYTLLFGIGYEGFAPIITTHEVGHTFSLYHATALDCQDAIIDTLDVHAGINEGSYCDVYEYGDPFDVMGGGGETLFYGLNDIGWHMSMEKKHNVNTQDAWIQNGAGSLLFETEASFLSSYGPLEMTLYPVETMPSNPAEYKGAKMFLEQTMFLKTSGIWGLVQIYNSGYLFEYRHPSSDGLFDTGITDHSGNPLSFSTSGVLIRVFGNIQGYGDINPQVLMPYTLLLDTTPESIVNTSDAGDDFLDAALELDSVRVSKGLPPSVDLPGGVRVTTTFVSDQYIRIRLEQTPRTLYLPLVMNNAPLFPNVCGDGSFSAVDLPCWVKHQQNVTYPTAGGSGNSSYARFHRYFIESGALFRTIPVSGGPTTVSFFARYEPVSGVTEQGTLYVRYTTSPTPLSIPPEQWIQEAQASVSFSPSQISWQRYTVPITPPSSSSVTVGFFTSLYGGNVIGLDEVSIERAL